MSQPEIFRRCSSCGVACKPGELFCAQCGHALATRSIAPAGTPTEQHAGAAEHDPDTKTNAGPGAFGTEETPPLPTPSLQTNQSARAPGDLQPGAVSATNHHTSPTVPIRPRHDSRMPGQERRSAARVAMEERLKPGVDRLRRVSSVVLDEAAYDPSVRFILVVGVLFLLFLVLLLLSKWIG